MSLTKVNYIDNSTIITAQNLNDIQDNIIELNKLEDKIIYGKGKNLLKNTAKSKTINGITFTVNEDGSVTCDGSTSTNVTLQIPVPKLVVGQSYTLSGCPEDGSFSTYILQIAGFGSDTGTGFTGTWSDAIADDATVTIIIFAGATVSNLTFYPMIRLASETDDTYEPYYEGLKEVSNKLSMELLWENASPTSEFGNTRINIDLSGFDFVDVEFRAVTTISYMSIFRNRVGSTTNCVSDNNGGKIVSRLVISYSDRVIFQKGYIYNTYGAYTENNAVLIPVRIYGIKGVFA